MDFCITNVCSITDSPYLKKKYISLKRKIMKFRVHELSEMLVFLKMDSSGIKGILQERILDFLAKELRKNIILPEDLEKKIEELNESCKIPIRKKSIQFVGPVYDVENIPTFWELRQLVYGRKFELENGIQTVHFEITPHLVHKIVSGKQADGSYRFEIQLNVWNYKSTEKWNNIYLSVEVNQKPVDVLHPSPHIIYVTQYCILQNRTRNTITISSPRPETLKDYAFCISVVKRLFPIEIIEHNTIQEVYDTASMISPKLDGITERSYLLCLTCPVTNSVITHPCRSTLCSHPEVFDLKTFLTDMQYYQQWTCPICFKVIKYDNLAMDMFLKKHLDEGKFKFMFHKRRLDSMLMDDEDILCDKEVIVIND